MFARSALNCLCVFDNWSWSNVQLYEADWRLILGSCIDDCTFVSNIIASIISFFKKFVSDWNCGFSFSKPSTLSRSCFKSIIGDISQLTEDELDFFSFRRLINTFPTNLLIIRWNKAKKLNRMWEIRTLGRLSSEHPLYHCAIRISRFRLAFSFSHFFLLNHFISTLNLPFAMMAIKLVKTSKNFIFDFSLLVFFFSTFRRTDDCSQLRLHFYTKTSLVVWWVSWWRCSSVLEWCQSLETKKSSRFWALKLNFS